MALNLKSQFSKLGSGPWEVYKTQGKGKILSQDDVVFYLKYQFSKTRVRTYKVYQSKHKHKTQGKGNILRHDHRVFNLKSQFSKPRVRT